MLELKCGKKHLFRVLTALILSAFLLFDLHTASGTGQGSLQIASQCPPVLKMTASGTILPIRVPEKTSLRNEASARLEQYHEKESRQFAAVLLLCLLCLFLFSSRRKSSRHNTECRNLPHNRTIWFIHRKDGKGPHRIYLF